ncbi:MAG TPA: methyl-accepting chemotaxis protein [Verrucomicrobiae bacterium]|nr:methyl-accepting chemotaxis protein [Verrucomicrobiae bacterium]
MNNLSIWQRLNLAVGLLIFLLLLGSGFALWMERAAARAEEQSTALGRVEEQVAAGLRGLVDVSRAALLQRDLDTDGKRTHEQERALNATLDQMQAAYQPYPPVLAGLKRARDFAQQNLTPFNRQVLALCATDPTNAAAYYAKNFPVLQEQQDKLLAELGANAETAASEALGTSHNYINWQIGIGLALLIAAFVLARFQSRSVTTPMQVLVGALEQMQRGDFTRRIDLQRQDEFGVVGNGLNKLADELSVLVGQVQRSGIQVNSTATEIAATAKEQQSTANEIAATTAEIGATSKEISATSKELVKTMNEVSNVSEETAELASTGQNAIGKMESTMRQIMDASGSITSKLAVLSEKTANINTVVTTITKVADQTNLLSLNAAIEAEKAGEYGLGFAVVAMEIRRLADQTAVATYDIEKMVKEMQSAVAAGVMGMDKFSEEVRRGVEEVRQVGTHLAQIIHQVQTLTPRFHTVNEGMHAQATGAQQISETLAQLNEAAQLTAESLRQSNLAIEQLNEAARGLQNAVARFKLKGTERSNG